MATTSMVATNTPDERWSHSTSMSRSRDRLASDGGVGAVGPVDRHPPAPGDEADDLVAGHRGAAPRQPDHQVVEALDVDADGRAPCRAGGRSGCWRAVTGSCSS